MKVSELGEFGLLDRLRGLLGKGGGGVLLGIGDDAAVVEGGDGDAWAFASDAMVEGVHFDLSYCSWYALGYKSLAVNLSDLASMGGCREAYALLSLGLTGREEVERIEEMYRGLLDCGKRYGCIVVGGDLVRSPDGVVVAVAVVGRMRGKAFLTRGGAEPGDIVMVTGSLGDSHLGLEWLMRGGSVENPCARRHLYPVPRLEEGEKSLRLGARASIDVSDGMIRDLGHICEESGVGAVVFRERIPVSEAACRTAEVLGKEVLQAALYGGEDYELLLVVREEDRVSFEKEVGATMVGRVTDGEGVAVVDEKGEVVPPGGVGYQHFEGEQ